MIFTDDALTREEDAEMERGAILVRIKDTRHPHFTDYPWLVDIVFFQPPTSRPRRSTINNPMV